jgi:hypothetical protein
MSFNNTMKNALNDDRRIEHLQQLNLSFDAHFLPSFPRKRDLNPSYNDWETYIKKHNKDYIWVVNDNNTLTFISAPKKY